MTIRACLIAAPLLAAVASPASARDDFQQWLSVSARVKLSDKVSVQNELNARFSEDRGGLYQIQDALLLGYKLNGVLTAAAGYVQSHEYRASDMQVERRLRQQLSMDNFAHLGGASLSGRLRTEQRWRDEAAGTAWRIRPQLKVSVPLGDKTAPSIIVSSEAFLNLNTTAFQSSEGLDRLRSTAVVSVPLPGGVRIEGGYLNQHRFVRGGPDTRDHALTASLSLSL